MGKTLLSVGLDIGTTTTQMVVSRLLTENTAPGFAVPRLAITGREVVYRSDVHFTPLLGKDLVDAPALERLLRREYEKAGIRPQDVDTGAVIITGETSRRENAAAVAKQISDLAGDFVVTTAGPALESVLAAKGAGAGERSQKTGKTVLHMDIGGGTANLALLREGRAEKTGCFNVGGRLVKWEQGAISYVSPVLAGLTELQVGDVPQKERLLPLARLLAKVLEMAAGLTPPDAAFSQLMTREAPPWEPVLPQELSFSGGVADCIEGALPWGTYGDLGVLLGQAIRESRLCQMPYCLGKHTIRATVMGAGCHATTLSGSTVFCKDVRLPRKNLPVAALPLENATPENIRAAMEISDEPGILALTGSSPKTHGQMQALAQNILAGYPQGELLICLEQDFAKALGQALVLRAPDRSCLCLDGLRLDQGNYLDIGQSVGPAMPVVIKTLIF